METHVVCVINRKNKQIQDKMNWNNKILYLKSKQIFQPVITFKTGRINLKMNTQYKV